MPVASAQTFCASRRAPPAGIIDEARRGQLVERIENGVALDQRLARVAQDKRRHAHQRIVLRDLVGIAEHRPWLVLERQTIEPHRDGDAARERAVKLADQNHGARLRSSQISIRRRRARNGKTLRRGYGNVDDFVARMLALVPPSVRGQGTGASDR
jgi:hypothetical protein